MAGVPLAATFVRVRPDVDKKEFAKKGKEAGETAGKEFADGFYRDAAGRLRRANGQFANDAEKAAHEGGTRSGKSFSKSFTKEIGKSSTLGRVASITASRYTLIGAAAVAATPGVLHLTAALLPAAGAINALPAGIAAFAVAAGTLKVATAGVGDAITKGLTGTSEQAEKAMAAVPPAAQRFARSIIVLKPQLDKLRRSVSERFFRPLTDDIKPLAEVYLPLLTRQMSNLAGPLGGLAEQLTQTGRSGLVLRTVNKLFADTRLSVIYLRGSIDPLVKAFAAIVGSTSKALPGLAKQITGLAQKFNTFIQGAAQSGAIFRGFQAGMQVLRDLGGIIINVGSIFASVLGAASAGSAGLLANIKALTGEAAAFLRSAQGLSTLASVFGVLGQLGAALRTALGAVLPAVAESLVILAPAIQGLIQPAVDLVVALSPLLPLFTGMAVQVITRLTPAIATLSKFLAEHATVVKVAATVFAAFLTVQKASAAILAVQAAGGLVSYVKGIKLVTAATKIWTAVQIVLDAALAASGIPLIIAGVAALIAGIVLLYRNNETFRKIVQAVWAAIKVAVKATVDWIVNVAWPAIKKAWDAIAAAALWLWHNVLQPVWNGIKAVIDFVVKAVKVYIQALVAEFRAIASVAMWLWRNVFGPVFAAIRKIVEVWWLAVQIVFKGIYNIVSRYVIAAITILRKVWDAVFTWISDKVRQWWTGIKIIFEYFKVYILGPLREALNILMGWFRKIFSAIASYITAWYRATIAPIFAAVRKAWDNVALGFSIVYNQKIKPVFEAFVGFIKKYVVGGFKTGVDAIAAAWDKVREAARKPVAFVVNKIINPFIGGLNNAAKLVGVKDRVDTIKGFQAGGEIPGHASGGRITGAPSATDNRLAPARIPGVGAVKLAGGEFVVNAADTRKALPLLKWINDGMKGGAQKAGRYIGRPMAELPGDGSEGWAFADGGLVGWTKDIWSAISNPETIKKPFEALFSKIPGGGMIKDFLIGSAKRLLNGAVSWLVGGSGTAAGGSAISTARAVRARTFVQSQSGKPYVWASAGPNGYDCSGIVSAAYNILKGGNPYNHTFSTGSLPGPWFDTSRKIGALTAGWSHPGQSPASASVGHMAGMVAGMPFESTGSGGVRIGSRARSVGQFANVGAARAMGGLIGQLAGAPVRLFDNGGMWPSGTLGANLSGRTEYVDPTGRGGGNNTYYITNNVAPGGHPAEVGRQTVLAIQAFERGNGSGWRKRP